MARRRPGSTILPSAVWGQLARTALGSQARDVVCGDRLTHAGQVDQSLHHRAGPFHLIGRAGQGDRLTPERDTHPEATLELKEIAVVHAGEQQRVGTFG